MKKSILLLIGLCCISLHSFSQLAHGLKHVSEIKKRPLLVILEDVENAKDPATAEMFNKTFKENVLAHWTLHKDITFITPRDMAEFRKKKVKELTTHAVMSITFWEVTKTTTTPGQNTGPLKLGSQESFSLGKSCALTVGLLEHVAKAVNYTFHHTFPTLQPSEANLVSGLLQAQDHMNKSLAANKPLKYNNEAKSNAGQLQKVVLLLDKDYLRKGITEKEVKQSYKLPFKVVSTVEIEEAIKNKTPGYAYVYALPKDLKHPTQKAQVVVNTEKGEILAFSPAPGFKIGLEPNLKIGTTELKQFAKYTK